ncbi:MAG: hypothetical protein ACREJC_13760 [Tepidisphaeraceae bacterium]
MTPAAQLPLRGQVLNVACGARIDLNQLAPMMCEMFGRSDLKPIHGPERAGDVKPSQADLPRRFTTRPQADR